MSSVSSVGQGIFQFTQSLSATPATSSGSATVDQTAQTSSVDGSTASGSTTMVHGGHHHGHGGHGAAFSKIADAVTSALEESQSNGSTEDPNQVVQNAIAQVLGQNPAGTVNSANDPDGDGDNDAAGEAGGEESGKATLLQTLQKFGIDPEQFRDDFQSAMKGLNGSESAQSLLPPGSLVDETI